MATTGSSDHRQAAVLKAGQGSEGYHDHDERELRCSFCGRKKPGQIDQLITGPPGTAICPDCVALCVRILAGKPPVEQR